MTRCALFHGFPAAALMSLAACAEQDQQQQPAGNPTVEQTGEAKEAAGTKTIAAGLGPNSRFTGAAKAAGLDATLGGPGPYTVLVPDDAAFTRLPAGTYDNWVKPESRAQLTGVLTYHILPGTVLAQDIAKAIQNANGKAVLATMGGSTLTATREGERIILTDGGGARATVTRADQRFTNGVVHHIDAVLMPAADQDAAAPPSQ